ncbi:MAG: hypothetical protein AAF290_10660 [Pseudomonadota bacterium]
MTKEREIRTETNWLGEEKQVIYEDGSKVGEIRSEERGGILGIGAERVDVEYDTSGNEVSYTTTEERGGIAGIGSEEVQVTYDSSDHSEIETSTVAERGGVAGIGSYHTRVSRDASGEEVAQTSHETRGGIFGIGGRRVKVRRSDNRNDGSSSGTDGATHGQSGISGAGRAAPEQGGHYTRSGKRILASSRQVDNGVVTVFSSIVSSLAVGALGVTGFLYVGQLVMYVGHLLTMPSHSAEGILQTLVFIAIGLVGAVIWLCGFVLSIPLFGIEYFTGWCLAVAPGVSYDPEVAVQAVSMCHYVD